MSKILVLQGHPYKESFCSALAKAYVSGAKDSGHEVKLVEISDLQFDPILHKGYRAIQPLEPDIIELQSDIKWADHLVVVYPTWWGSLPALLKGLFDRFWLPGFAFRFKHAYWPTGLLSGRSARLIITMDSPWLMYRLFYGAAGRNIIKKSILQFAGFRPIKTTAVDWMKVSTDKSRAKWLKYITKLGSSGL